MIILDIDHKQVSRLHSDQRTQMPVDLREKSCYFVLGNILSMVTRAAGVCACLHYIINEVRVYTRYISGGATECNN